MAVNLADTPELVTPGNLGDELASFIRAMRANNVSPNTIIAYGGAVRQFGRWQLACHWVDPARRVVSEARVPHASGPPSNRGPIVCEGGSRCDYGFRRSRP